MMVFSTPTALVRLVSLVAELSLDFESKLSSFISKSIASRSRTFKSASIVSNTKTLLLVSNWVLRMMPLLRIILSAMRANTKAPIKRVLRLIIFPLTYEQMMLTERLVL